MALDSMQEIFDRIETAQIPFWRVVLETDMDERQVTEEEYEAVLSWMYLNDLEGFTQEESAADSQFIPDF